MTCSWKQPKPYSVILVLIEQPAVTFRKQIESGGEGSMKKELRIGTLREYRPFSIGFIKRLKLDMTKFLLRNKSNELVLISAVR